MNVPHEVNEPVSRAARRFGSRRRLLALGLAAGATALAGCSSLVSRPSPVKRTFLLDPPLPAATGVPKPAVLRIGAINVAAPFRGKSFVFRRSDLGYESDYYDEFFVPPSTMLVDATAKALAAAKVFERVVPAGAAGNEGDFLLEGFVSALYADARDEAHPAAQIAITFYLSSMAALGSAPLWTHEYAQHAPLASREPEAFAQAMNVALGAVLRDLARDLAAAPIAKPAA